MFNVHEALKILKRHYVTDNIQMVSRFIREGRLVGERGTRKDGWKIKESDLYDFIDEEKPGIIEMVYIYDKYSESVFVPTSEDYLSKKKKLHVKVNEQLDEPLSIQNENTPDVLHSANTKEVDIDGISHKVAKKKKIKYEKVTYDKFCEILKKNNVISQDESITLIEELKLVYFVYYDQTTTLREEILCDNGFYSCPLLPDQTQKTFLPLLKNSAPKLLEKAKLQVLYYGMDGKVKVKEGYSEEQVKMNIPVQEVKAPNSAITDQNINEKDVKR